MKKVIYKYGPLHLDETTEVIGYPIKVDIQDSNIFVWSIVSKDPVSSYNRKFQCRIIPTGEEYDASSEMWIGTVVTPHGLVWHVIGK